jgi:hypothetical protein
MIGFSAGAHKTAELVRAALQTISYASIPTQLFHTDRESELDNAVIDDYLEAHQIQRSLRRPAETMRWLKGPVTASRPTSFPRTNFRPLKI